MKTEYEQKNIDRLDKLISTVKKTDDIPTIQNM